jgi:hypothetical protein
MNWTTIGFGKHKGKTLPQVMFKDPDWFFYLYQKGAFKGALAREADDIICKARRVKVPTRNGQQMFVKYIIHHKGKFGTMELVPSGQTYGLSNVSEVIDFAVPWQMARYDKLGYKNFLSAFKAIVFGNASCRMSKKACAVFFDDDRNFY